MKIIKTKKLFTYMVVGALVMALSISCKSNEEPEKDYTGKTPPDGVYSQSATGVGIGNTNPYLATVTNKDGVCHIKGSAINTTTKEATNFDITVTKWWSQDGGEYNYAIFRGDAWNSRDLGELTITEPAGADFRVCWYMDGWFNIENLSIAFKTTDGKEYNVDYLRDIE